jgi:hypothetical protein
LGILRLSDSSILELSRDLCGAEFDSGLVKGVTSLKDGMVGAGFTDGWMVGVEGGEGCDFIGAGIFLGTETFGGSGAEVAFIGSGGCNRLGRVMVGGAEGKCRVSTKGDWS